jgi:hypothetical protein
MKLYSYVIDHDFGFAPNPFNGFCTLAKCKYRKGKRKNIIELAQIGDWIAGTGGQSKLSAGNGKLIYAMRVDEKLTLPEYYQDIRFKGRSDNTLDDADKADRFVLISEHYFYFGKNAIDIDRIPKKCLDVPFEKKGPNFKSNFNEDFMEDFIGWLEMNYTVGIHGPPCGQIEIPSVSIELYL